jgi:branched-chain amino acid aminotransferase
MSAESRQAPAWGWMNGRFLPWSECVVHVRAQAVMTGASVFEGIRAYWNADDEELYVLKLREHLDRLRASMKVLRMNEDPPGMAELEGACVELLARNEFREDVHIIPVAYAGVGQAWQPLTPPLEEGVFVTAVPRPTPPHAFDGIAVAISSWRRLSDDVMPPRVKAAANYGNSRLALHEARANGYDNALLLNAAGTVSEATGACVVMVREGRACTPPVTAGILESITRSSLMELLANELGVEVVEREIDRTELYVADELFMCGTGHEVTPIVSVDRIRVGDGSVGQLTKALQERYFALVRGQQSDYPDWRTPVYAGRSPAP